MKYVVVAVRDTCGDIYGVPMFQASLGTAQRAFSDAVNRPDDNNLIYKHPEHFELYYLGDYDDADGSFSVLPKPKQLLLGSNCVVKPGAK